MCDPTAAQVVVELSPTSIGGMRMSKSINLPSGIVAGAIVGAVAGIMFAPRPGKETRKIVVNLAGKIQIRASHYIGNLRDKFRKGASPETLEVRSESRVKTSPPHIGPPKELRPPNGVPPDFPSPKEVAIENN